jgi:hypothetical protein
MEDTQTWGHAERVVFLALRAHEDRMASGQKRIGYSLPRTICDALREAELLVCDECGLRPPAHKMDCTMG